MALKPVRPFSRDAFLREIQPFPSWLVERLTTHVVAGRKGWAAHLQEYEWNGGDWRRGQSDREEHSRRLAGEATPEELNDVAAEMLAWGSIRTPFLSEDLERMQRTLSALDRARDGVPHGRRSMRAGSPPPRRSTQPTTSITGRSMTPGSRALSGISSQHGGTNAEESRQRKDSVSHGRQAGLAVRVRASLGLATVQRLRAGLHSSTPAGYSARSPIYLTAMANRFQNRAAGDYHTSRWFCSRWAHRPSRRSS